MKDLLEQLKEVFRAIYNIIMAMIDDIAGVEA